ncbi:conserved Plasmodium protein, unknown function [Plasmodium gallinaceum]|uniref:Uncharacterized protein n=1 Tax=Plasmodium gallinaceum TaxID=5849 RepID=A0A1J1GUL7_PLAGA|nr:conserved Plasmodium protein, unknown function [Plasmodium gallinaceum]CRG96146.1 conserved Plasmodium protein, unknown function [Plasmodium gallinaceum]
MGNTTSKDEENQKRNLILLDDNFLHNFQKKDNTIFEKKLNNIEKDDNLHKNNIPTKINGSVKSTKSEDPLNYKGEEYDKLRKMVIDDLIIESEKYISMHKDKLNNINKDNLKIPQTNNECLYNENKIYDCLKNMNESTSDFINSYTRCYRYLRKYESCVQKIKI